MSSSIERELIRCRQSAEEGYDLANAKYSDIKNTLIDAANSLSKTDKEQSQVSRIRNTELVEKQKSELQQLRKRIDYIGDDLQNLRGRMKDFSIVVYGRTMAGKSTLMEILTHGNGQSIGKGSQRTTLDVRDYYWNGLKITDVPGISAFSLDEKEARVDERLALEAAKKADLILFLLTSDAPQPDEAEKLAQLRSLGKPVLGVINVKMSFNINDDLDIEDLQDKLADTSTIDATISQFKKFSANHNQDWSGIKFVATHLLSAYQSQDKNPKVFRISRFAEVEDFILEKVRNDGRFLRIKTFADSVAVPMSNVILEIYKHSGNTLLESDIWFDKRRQLDEWIKKFDERSAEKFDNLYKQLSEELDNAIYNFAEEAVNNDYSDDNVNRYWQQRLQNLKFDEKYQNLLKSLADECERKRKELSDELTQELSYAFSGNTSTNISLEGTTPWGKYLFAASNLLVLIPGIGWGARIAIGVGSFLISALFENKQEKIRKAKAKLREDLKAPSYDVLNKMHNQVREIFNKEIWNKGYVEFWNLLAGYQFMLARLGNSQYNMASALFSEFSDLNFKLLVEASNYKGAGYAKGVSDIPRIPGETMIILADSSNLDTKKLSDLLGESVSVMKPEENFPDTLKKVLGSDYDVDYYPLDFAKENENAEEAIALFPKKKVDATNFKLAQQIAGVPIIAEFTQPQRVTQPQPSTQSTRRNNQTNTTSSGGRQQQSNAFKSDFAKIDEMLERPRKSNEGIKKALKKLEAKVSNQRNAEAMNQVAIYYGRIHAHDDCDRCFALAEMYAR